MCAIVLNGLGKIQWRYRLLRVILIKHQAVQSVYQRRFRRGGNVSNERVVHACHQLCRITRGISSTIYRDAPLGDLEARKRDSINVASSAAVSHRRPHDTCAYSDERTIDKLEQ